MKKTFYILVILFSPSVFACSVPVFRYALEYWRPDPYQIIFLYNSTNSNNYTETLNELNNNNKSGSFVFRKVKVTNQNDKIILKYPADKGIRNIVCEAPLSKKSLSKILNSPARKNLVKKLLDGDSMVFLLLEGNNPKQNNLVVNNILKFIPILEKEIKLPHQQMEIPEADRMIYDTNIVFKLSFMCLSRTNKQEKVFIKTLTRSLPRSIYKKSVPIVFPIFGRGRMLTVLLPKDVNYKKLKKLCEYVAGECSCEVKNQNPGFDIFLPCGWKFKENQKIISEIILPPLSGFSEFIDNNSSIKNSK